MLRKFVHGNGALANRRRIYKSGTMRRAEATETQATSHAPSEHGLRVGREISGIHHATVHDAETPMAEMLFHAERMASLGTLAAGVAHEINNPLTYVLVNVEHVLRRIRADMASNGSDALPALSEHVAALTAAVEGGNRVRQIVRDLMTFARGNVDQRAVVDVRRTLEAALQMAWHELKHRATVDKRLRDVPPVHANEARLAHVFLTLLINAAESMPEGDASLHRVTVNVSAPDDGTVVVEIADTGAGIPAAVLPRVFEPFFTTKDAGSGTGMGLAVAHGTIKSLGGQLTVESELGHGTTFRVVLPVAEGFASRTSDKPSKSAFALPRRVLVIDDDAQVADAIRLALADEHDVTVLASAREALTSLAAGARYDVILCDLMMPEMTGMAFYREVLGVAPALASRIVFLTGGTFTRTAREFVEAIPNRCLEKPPDISKLRELVRQRRT